MCARWSFVGPSACIVLRYRFLLTWRVATRRGVCAERRVRGEPQARLSEPKENVVTAVGYGLIIHLISLDLSFNSTDTRSREWAVERDGDTTGNRRSEAVLSAVRRDPRL